MRRYLAVLVVAVTFSTGVTTSPAVAARRPALVKAIVVLASQVDPGGVHGRSKHERQTALVRALRARAATDQVALLKLLRQRRAQGSVGDIVPLWVLNAVSVSATPAVLAELAARPDVREIDPDRTLLAPPPTGTATTGGGTVEPNVNAIDAPALWDLGLTGQGVVVASMDTGVDGTHPDLAARWRGGTNSWYDPNGEHTAEPTDVNGHGTSTMGVIVGGSAGGTSIGVAPDASWIAVKIFNDRGASSTTKIHQGFQWLLDPDGNPATADAPDVVNDSWTGSAAGCVLDFQPDLRNLRAAGILPVFSAGNYGPTASTVLSPANLPEALSVGGIDGTGVIDPSSSRGPSACGGTAPRVVAPGVNIHTSDLYGGYVDTSGTSLAAPHVTGALALLLGAFPESSPESLQTAMESTAVDLGDPGADNSYGYGRIDALAAYDYLRTTPDFTLAATPASGTVVAGSATAYTIGVGGVSGFTDTVSLSLTGLPATVGTATFTPAAITTSGTATLTIATAATATPGTYSLTVSGTAGAIVHTVPVRLVVTPQPDFTLSAAPSSVSVLRTKAASYTISTTATGGFSGSVTLSIAGSPTRSTVTFTPNPMAAAGTSTLKVATTSLTPRGTYPLKITGTSGSLKHQVTVTLVVG